MDEVENLMGGTEEKQVEMCPCLMKYPLPRWFLQTRCWRFLSMYMGTMYTVFVVFVLLYFNAYTSCPVYYGSDDECYYPILFAYFVILEILLNFCLFHYAVRFNRVESILPPSLIHQYSQEYRNSGQLDRDVAADGYSKKYCATCKIVIPQRCHHCPLCKYCVMKKDHHCFITGGCVGYANQRYFIVFLFWAAVGALYGLLYMIRYLSATYQPFMPWGIVGYILPVTFVKWLFLGTCTFRQLLEVMLFNMGCMSTSGAVVFLGMQMYLIHKNITMYERMKKQFNSEKTRPPLCERLKRVFGPMFLLNFIIPLPFYKNKMDEALLEYVQELQSKEI